ncbi:b8734848-affc-4a2d-92fb-cc507b3940cd [Sclerotinia trifoliorum]|uniref:B8734848-affc-4a2d-92fb-cc507b3940cd n=1 Tax=Sclerotinia trifoliorum TaxID=28548 RepID=A0A8H2W1M0_9HELO|nr:b8734848-affc-4a2d-92fb-cc507b3940cd [Sclerotinia trifoliorum]
MGKASRNKTKHRADPTAKTVKPPTDPELAAIRVNKILPILQDLQSADQSKRSTAATAIANLVDDAKCRKLFLREQIVRILLEQTLTDSSMETRIAGWGIMRNLALEEEADFCVHLYRQDILTAIEGAVKSIIETIDSKDLPLSKLPKPQQDLLWNLTSSVITLLTSLSEADIEIVEAISKISTIVNFLFGLLSLDTTPLETHNEALSCLAVLTEENKTLVEFITEQNDWFKLLMRLKNSGGFKGVATCGVLHNIFTVMNWADSNTPMDGASDAILLPTLIESMQQAQQINSTNGKNGHTTHSSPDRVLQMALEITASIATSLQEALELGNGKEEVFEGFGDDEEVDEDQLVDGDADLSEGDLSDGENEMTQEDMEADMDMVLGDDSEEEETSNDQDTLHQLIQLACPVVIALAQPSEDSKVEDDVVQTPALAALNNIAWTVSSIDFSKSHLGNLQKAWASLAQRIWDEVVCRVLASNTANIELAASTTSIAWAVCKSVQGRVQIRADEHRKFMALYHASKGFETPTDSKTGKKDATDLDDSAFQSLGVKCIGVLGSLALEPAPTELNREIGVFLVTLLAGVPETPAAHAVEALNEIFDIYADKSYSFDQSVFWGNGFDKHLEEILPKCKKMAKTIDKRKSPELRSRVDEAVLNLARFLKYKGTEKSS